MKSTYVCPRVNLKIRGIDFQVDLVVLTSSGIYVILGMDWLGECDGIILCAKKSVLLTVTPSFRKTNQVHTYMYARIKFHTYSRQK
jgi:hypothetical protein